MLIPARNEADRIGPVLASVLAQTGVPGMSVRVFDDDSSDGTTAVVEQVAAADPRVWLLRGPAPLPRAGSARPTRASASPTRQLSDAASAGDPVLVFLDADVVLEPHAISSAVALLNAGPADFASVWPRQLASGTLARLVQPLQQWSWATTLPLGAAARSPRPSLTAANGQFLIMTAQAYRAAGGHAAVAGCVLEDIELARAAKRAGRPGRDLGRQHPGLLRDVRVRGRPAGRATRSRCGRPSVRATRRWAFGRRVRPAVMGLLGWAYLVPPIAAAAGPTRRVRLLGLAGIRRRRGQPRPGGRTHGFARLAGQPGAPGFGRGARSAADRLVPRPRQGSHDVEGARDLGGQVRQRGPRPALGRGPGR